MLSAFEDSDFQAVKSKSRKQPTRHRMCQRPHEPRFDLASFKTCKCTDNTHHNWLQCERYHVDSSGRMPDRRRNPYNEQYFPDEALNDTEKLYHPILFRTILGCKSSKLRATPLDLEGATLQEIDSACKYGKYCAFAHYPEEVQTPVSESLFCTEIVDETRKKPTYFGDIAKVQRTLSGSSSSSATAAFPTVRSVPKPAAFADWAKPVQSHKNIIPSEEECLRTSKQRKLRYSLENSPIHLFRLLHSKELWIRLQSIAAEGACRIEVVNVGGKGSASEGNVAIEISGTNQHDVMLDVRACLDSNHWSDIKSRTVRFDLACVAEILHEDFQEGKLELHAVARGHGKSAGEISLQQHFWNPTTSGIVPSEKYANAQKKTAIAWVNFDSNDPTGISIHCALNLVDHSHANQSATLSKKNIQETSALLDSLLEGYELQIRQFVDRNGYKGGECLCCYQEKLTRDFIRCPNDHYICADVCFNEMVKSQQTQLKAQGLSYKCPNCNADFTKKEIAAHIDHKEFDRIVVDPMVEIKVSIQTDKLQSDFDRRLQQEMEKMMDQYATGNVAEQVVMKAKLEAKKIRDTIINLCCPSCHMVYLDFTGCMALQCEGCKTHFCAYCHKEANTGRGCHEHVRMCPYNLTDNNSYYADPEIIKDAQRRYRRRKLKKYLLEGGFKKQVQNAIVMELCKDLNDLGIDPAGLLEVGYLAPEE